MLRRQFAAALGALLGWSATADAQDWPARPINMVVPYAAGGPVDTIGRIMAARMSELLGQQIIVENIGGAGGMTGAARVAKATPDGYTLLLSGSASARHQPDALQAAALQCDHRLRAGGSVFGLGTRADRAQGLSRQHAAEFIAYAKANRPRCSTARPAEAPARMSAPSCSTSRWAPRSRTCPIAARARRCRT